MDEKVTQLLDSFDVIMHHQCYMDPCGKIKFQWLTESDAALDLTFI